MPRRRYDQCRDCKAKATPYRHISTNGFCPPCQINRMERGVRMMAAKSGPTYERWRRNLLEALTK